MPSLNGIIHPDPLTQKKVNFFLDCFIYTTKHIGILENLPLENPLSLIQKIVFQIESNLDKSQPYILDYLSNMYFTNDDFLKTFDGYPKVESFIRSYKNAKPKERNNIAKSNLRHLNNLELEIEETMFSKCLKDTISFLKCTCKLEEHIEDIKTNTHLLVSEFLLSGRDRESVLKIFENVFTRDIDRFPFPQNIKTKKDKRNYFNSNPFDRQFLAIESLLKYNKHKKIYMFRIFGLSVKDNFKFKYDQVTFISRENKTVKRAKASLEKNTTSFKQFFVSEPFIMAYVKVHYYSNDLGKKEAIRIINKEIIFLRISTNANIQLEPFSYIVTNDFKHYGYNIGLDSSGTEISQEMEKELQDNPFVFLNKHRGECAKSILECEHLLIAAIDSGKASDFWHYLEILIPKKHKNKIKDVVSNALLINSFWYLENRLKSYVRTAIHPLSVNHKILGLNEEDHYKLFRVNFSLEYINNKIKHPFLNSLLTDWKVSKQKPNYKYLRSYYYSILNEAYSIRNSYIHDKFSNEKSELKIYNTLPKLISRFRWVIFDEIKKNKWDNFDDLIDHIYLKGQNL